MLGISDLYATLGNFTLKGISFDVSGGECLSLVGPNGSGKTALMECITGIHQVDTGRIEINGIDVTDVSPEKRKVGYVPQGCLLFPHLRVEENVGFGLRKTGIDARDSVREIMEWLEISHLVGRDVKSLSGGEKQKVALARALVIQPDVLLMDESLSAIDLNSKERLLKELKKILDEVRHTFSLASIFVTHNLAEAHLVGDRVAIMNNGQIEQIGSWDQITRTPNSRFIAGFLGFNILQGQMRSIKGDFAVVEINGKTIRGRPCGLKDGEAVTVALKPGAVSLSLEDSIKKPRWRSCQCNVLEGSITGMRKLESIAQILVNVGFPLNSEISLDLLDELNITVGSSIFAQFRASDVIFLQK